MYNIYQLGLSAVSYEPNLERLPFGKVTVVVGQDEEGNEVSYRSIAQGDTVRAPENDTEYENTYGKELLVNNPFGTQAIANGIMTQIKGYTYLPYEAKDSLVPIAADIGDVVRIAGDQSIIAYQDLYFDGLASSDIGAPGADETDNEFGLYTSQAEKDRIRSEKALRASFIVELGRIEASLEENYQTKAGMSGYVEKTSLNTSIGQYIDSSAGTAKVVAAASGTYQRKSDMGNYVLSSSLNTSIGQYIDSQAGTAKIVSAASGTYQTKAAMSGYVTTSSLNNSIGQYIDTQAGTAKIVAAVSGTYQTISGMSGYVTKSSLDASITAHINTQAGIAEVTSAVSATYQRKDAMGNYVLNSNLNNSITQYVNSTTGKNSIVASVSGSFAGKSYENRVEVSESKIGWLIKSGTSASNFTMTDRAIQLTAGTINLSGYATFASLSTPGTTVIDGSNISTETLRVKTIYPPNDDRNAVLYCEGSGYKTLHMGSNQSWAQIEYVDIQGRYGVTIGRYEAERLYFDTYNKIVYPYSTSYLWKLGKTDRPFSEIVVNKITFSPNNSSSQNVSLTASVSGSYYTLTPSADKVINLGTTTRRFNEFYVFKAVIGTNDSTSQIGFFGTTPIAKQTLSTSSANMGYTSATASNYLVILNNVVGILSKKYGMFAS